MEFLYFLIIGAVSGWLAGQLWKGSGFGLIGNIIVGILGGFAGGFLAGKLGLGGNGLLWQIIVSAVGAWILLWIVSLIKSN